MSGLRFPSAIPGLIPINQGKTRDLFVAKVKKGPYVGTDLLAIVATDRLSTHNIVHVSTIPEKGAVLTALTVFWLAKLFPAAGLESHLVAYGKNIYDYLDLPWEEHPADLHHRCIIVRKVPVIPIEFIFRSYLCGSLYNSYYAKGIPNPYGIDLPAALQLMHPFSEPIFTPTEKSDTDDPVTTASVLERYPEACALARRAYILTRNHLLSKGDDQIDVKFEIGIGPDGKPIIVDEVSTPDTSRFVKVSDIRLGVEPPWRDKEVARIEATRVWGKGPKVPLTFSPQVVQKLTDTYLDICATITGSSLQEFQFQNMSY